MEQQLQPQQLRLQQLLPHINSLTPLQLQPPFLLYQLLYHHSHKLQCPLLLIQSNKLQQRHTMPNSKAHTISHSNKR